MTTRKLDWQGMIVQAGIVGAVAGTMTALGVGNIIAGFIPSTMMGPAVATALSVGITVGLAEIAATLLTSFAT
jgi:hypothetical protein